jgi:hypothetical protein
MAFGIAEKKKKSSTVFAKKNVLDEISSATQIQQLAPKLLFLLDLCAK